LPAGNLPQEFRPPWPLARAGSPNEQTLPGTVATTISIIAVATVGLMMLSGRVNFRYGATVILGCFIIFGASAIVAGIQSFAGGGGGLGEFAYRPEPPLPPEPALAPPAAVAPANHDPYAGASVPSR
jgi:type IV secretion system protein VirB2